MQIGHAGTLDPMATGLLIICTGKGTKAIDGFVAMKKAYSGTLRLGQATPSYDAETDVSTELPWEHITGIIQMTDILPMDNHSPDEGQVYLSGWKGGALPDYLACMYTALLKCPPKAEAWQNTVSVLGSIQVCHLLYLQVLCSLMSACIMLPCSLLVRCFGLCR